MKGILGCEDLIKIKVDALDKYVSSSCALFLLVLFCWQFRFNHPKG